MKNSILQSVMTIFQKMTYKDWLILILICMTVGFFLSSRYYRNESYNNVVVYTDSIQSYKNKIKQEYVSKSIYVQDIDDLKKQKNVLADEVKNLKENPVVVTKTVIRAFIDTVYMDKDTIAKVDSIYKLHWYLDHRYYNIDGITIVDENMKDFNTVVNKFSMPAELTIDVIDDGDKLLRLIGRTDNPYINITNLDGVVFDPSDSKVLKKYQKPKKWSIGPSFGIGVGPEGKIQPVVSVGISYGIWQF